MSPTTSGRRWPVPAGAGDATAGRGSDPGGASGGKAWAKADEANAMKAMNATEKREVAPIRAGAHRLPAKKSFAFRRSPQSARLALRLVKRALAYIPAR